MTLGTHLSLRIAAIMVVGFVVLQFLVFGAMTLPDGGDREKPYGFPPPDQLAAIVDTLDAAPLPRRALLAAALDGSLYTLSIEPRLTAPSDPGGTTGRAIEQDYRQALSGRDVRLSARTMFPRLARSSAWPGRLMAPATLEVSLRGGEALVLVSRPSPAVRAFLGQRAALGASAGLLLLFLLAWAVRQSTRPVTRLAVDIRAFSTRLDGPDLAIEGPPELRDLATAYNEMKTRIADLISERTRILAGIAHDLRTYLTRLRLRAEFIDDPVQRARASRDLSEMSLLLDDTLLFAQPASRPAQLEHLAIGAELEEIVAMRREMGEAVTLEPVPSEWLAVAERLSLRRAYDGPGVPADMLPRLGQAFDRLDPSRDRSTGGAGLGLAIVRALVDRQNGEVQFRNGPAGGLEATVALVRKS